MIIELFGPSGVGKTTLAYALANALQENGHKVQLVVSSRPAEGGSDVGRGKSALARLRSLRTVAPLTRAGKLISAVPAMLPGKRGDRTARDLMNLLPPSNRIWTIRYQRYLTQLCRSWSKAKDSDEIIIFDQAFLTALCSLALLARSSNSRDVECGLNLLPRPDLLVCIDAPRELLEARLRQRLQRQGPLERLFEFDLETNLKQFEVAQEVTRMLQEQQRPMVRVRSHNLGHLETAVNAILLEAGGQSGGLAQ